MSGFITEVHKKIMKSDRLTLVLVVSEGCMTNEHIMITELQQKLEELKLNVYLIILCFDENDMLWPIPITNVIYYFAPKNTKPLFYRRNRQAVLDLEKDVTIANKMISGMNFVEASLTEEQKKLVETTDSLLAEEEKQSLPTNFQMVRNLAKDIWKTAKQAGKGLPILVKSDVAIDRFKLCESCEYLTDESRCEKCGCFMKVKVNLAASSCPIGKWGSV